MEKCQSCGQTPAEKLHICPYNADIHGDSESLCNCCSACEYECYMDI